MQLFEFSKQLLLHLKKEKDAKLAGQPGLEATGQRPIRLTARIAPEYDDAQLPVKTMHLGVATPHTPSKTYALEVPAGTLLRRERDISDWLGTVMEFVGSSHGMALERSLHKVNELRDREALEPLKAGAFINPHEWETRLVLHEGKLSELPVETALREMDRLQKMTLSGWRESKKDAKLMVKTFLNAEDAGHARELLHLILQVGGLENRALRKDIEFVPRPDEDKYLLRLPRKYLDEARRAEVFLD
ncbi:MAG: hypothetical protein EBV03_10360 [Proteobacteria bacterium]|nr:hypothetical protein [Pseudomonadota bacterium]